MLATAWCMVAYAFDQVLAFRVHPRPEVWLYIAAAITAIVLGWAVAWWT